jgi:hypothetical protein
VTDSPRSLYLSWRDEVERFVASGPAQIGVVDVSQLQSPRNRNLVADTIPADQLYPEVAAEVHLALSVLSRFAASVRKELAAPELSHDDRDVEFVAESGRAYSYRIDVPLGVPGRYGAVFEGRDDHGVLVAVKRVGLRTSERYRAEDARFAEREVEIGRHLRGLGDHLAG